ncbi:MAG: hypothetical protein U1E78_06870 [Gammaproteobacteria bacterium]
MPRLKKTAVSKTAPKAKRGRPAKMTAKTAAPTKSKKELNRGKALEQNFQESLNALAQFWSKEAKAQKQQLADLKVKHKKALQKQKSASNPRASDKLKQEVHALKQGVQAAQTALANAKLSADKSAQLTREVAQFEKAWKAAQKAKKAEKAEKAEKADKVEAKPTKAAAADKPKAKRGRKPKSAAPVQASKPKGKRGRKPKASQAVAEVSLNSIGDDASPESVEELDFETEAEDSFNTVE